MSSSKKSMPYNLNIKVSPVSPTSAMSEKEMMSPKSLSVVDTQKTPSARDSTFDGQPKDLLIAAETPRPSIFSSRHQIHSDNSPIFQNSRMSIPQQAGNTSFRNLLTPKHMGDSLENPAQSFLRRPSEDLLCASRLLSVNTARRRVSRNIASSESKEIDSIDIPINSSGYTNKETSTSRFRNY